MPLDRGYATGVIERALGEVGTDSSLDIGTRRRPSGLVEERVSELMSKMSLREKLAQLYSMWLRTDESGQVAPHQHDFAPSSIDWEELVQYGLGQLTRPYGTAPVDPVVGAHHLAQLQRRVVQAGRFGIPAMVHEECLTGLTAWQATIYPSPLCWGASFDPQMVEQMGARSAPRCASWVCTKVWPPCSTSYATCAGGGWKRPSGKTRSWWARSGART